MCLRKKTIGKKSLKCLQYDEELFRSKDAFKAYTDFYRKTVIIVERKVNLESLSQTFILEVFRDRTWTKLLTGLERVWEPVILEFFLKCY